MENKLIQGNCLEVMKGLENNSVNLTITSPPYDNLRDYNGYSFDFENIAKELFRITKDGGVVVWVVGDATINGSETGTSFKQALFFMECGFKLHDTMIYRKINYIPLTHKRYEQEFEYMFILVKSKIKTFNPLLKKNKLAGKTYNPKRPRKYDNHSIRHNRYEILTYKEFGQRGNIFDYVVGAGAEKTNHPATFPEKLAEDHILSWSKEGDVVLDPMAGSGTTLKVAKKLNRKYIGIEISKEYIEIISKRLSQQTLTEQNE